MKTMRLAPFLCVAVLLVGGGCEAAESPVQNDNFTPRTFRTEYENIRLSRVAGPFEHPWAVAFLPDGRKLVTERPGRLNVVDQDGGVTRVTGTPTVLAVGQGGLLDVVIHPDYAQNGWIYLTYSKPNMIGQTATALARGRLSEDNEFVDVEELFEQDSYSMPGRHYGSRLAWMNDGTLLMTIGDRGRTPMRAQDTADHAGTLLRLNDDGSVPQDNPFVDDDDVLDEIYTYGHRNTQGLVVDPETGDIWSTEHGPRGGDELNKHSPGKNYGWPIVTRGRDYGTEEPFPDAKARRMEGIEPPVYEFLPTHPPSGLALVSADVFDAWKGNLLAGGLLSERIRRVVIEEDEVVHEEELLLKVIGRIRDVRQGPDGYIYVLNDHSDGALYVIQPND